MTSKQYRGGAGVPPGGGRLGGGEAAAMLATAAAIVAAQQFGLWPEALHGAAGVIVPPVAVLLPALPRGLRWVIGRLLRRRIRQVEPSPVPSGERYADRVAVGSPDGVEPDTTRPRPAEHDRVATFRETNGGDEGREVHAIIAAHLPDPTMWPTWVPTADNDDTEMDEPDEDAVRTDHDASAPAADNDDAAKPTAM